MLTHSHALILVLFTCLSTCVRAQTQVKGQLRDAEDFPVLFANVAMYADSNLIKVETTDEAGVFRMQNVAEGEYRLVASYLGAPDLEEVVTVTNQPLDLGVLRMAPAAVELAEATVVAKRALVEIKPDRTVFNVQGTINAIGDNGLDLLRKAPGVTIDNNENINILSRSGVIVYVDGKRLPLRGDELSAYLRSLTAVQIDRIDIITNPGAKYEAEGNAGIIDIRLVKNENEGTNGTASYTIEQGIYNRMNGSVNGNYRRGKLNAFGQLGYVEGKNLVGRDFTVRQNGIETVEKVRNTTFWRNVNYRFGADFSLTEKHTLGFLFNGHTQDGTQDGTNEISIAQIGEPVDSILQAGQTSDEGSEPSTYNLNYRYEVGNDHSLNIDVDYGQFRNTALRNQPNRYVTSDRTVVLSTIINNFDTPQDINIYTFKADYERPLAGGSFSTGVRLSRVNTNNSFLFFDVLGGQEVRNDDRSNRFAYSENVYAGYLNYAGQLNDRFSYSAGLRLEATDATGDLTAFNGQDAPPVEQEYVSLFPTVGLTYALNQEMGNALSLNYGRRINRPNYNVLNPFRNQLSQLSFELGNPNLQPEIVDNVELGYTLASRYNFKFAYSHTSNQITRLVGPDPIDPRAGFVSWDNLASQDIFSFSASLPVTVTKWWNAFFNVNTSHISNQADYGDDGIIDLQVYTYNAFSQHTFTLPYALIAELSGSYSGPGLWGGVFEIEPFYAVNVGFQRRFLGDQLNIKLSFNDIFRTLPWEGSSEFNGQVLRGTGFWDSRDITLVLSYSFGNQRVKSRKRETGLGAEGNRVGP